MVFKFKEQYMLWSPEDFWVEVFFKGVVVGGYRLAFRGTKIELRFKIQRILFLRAIKSLQ